MMELRSSRDTLKGPEHLFPSGRGLVHHTSYFQQKQTIGKLRAWRQIPCACAGAIVCSPLIF